MNVQILHINHRTTLDGLKEKVEVYLSNDTHIVITKEGIAMFDSSNKMLQMFVDDNHSFNEVIESKG